MREILTSMRALSMSVSIPAGTALILKQQIVDERRVVRLTAPAHAHAICFVAESAGVLGFKLGLLVPGQAVRSC